MKKSSLPFSREIEARNGSLVELRRDFHKHAELSFQEHRTAAVIAERIAAAGLEVRTGIAGPGVVGVLHGDKPGRTVAWRADIDALPISEAVQLPFASVNEGVMHACGHDGHTAIAITLAEILAERRADLPGTVVFIFQPGEEVVSGAKPMIEAGVLDDPPVECVLGLHLSARDPVGQVIVRPGPSMASADFFDVEIKGSGGHGAFPHLSVDPITVAAHILIGMQDLITREISAQETAVLTVGQVESGNKHNIIPDTAYLRGTIRTFRQEVRDQLVERLGSFASRIAQAYRAEARLHLTGEYCPPVDNDVDQTERVRQGAVAEFGEEAVTEGVPIMGSDDMSLFLKERPGCYFRVGAGFPGEVITHHQAHFRIDEAGLAVGLRLAMRSVLDALQP
ncbi:MAG: M20 family metallopeptidase [SAR324 cluster bacterium]|nr:M20 family metallopeptidase [SAR324 cluster bacterium]MCZ6627307.1 M20 family metallopeptidase [SAR324 cluster bacterium]MCZ6647524.1 M20 family metallopeptidase [SAR324 cluster bacterium]MCZ6728184.1 M20 family metallopeptidase [SAR324 cluster bacterium]MCZ6843922.1 M20 family metallopeptidase [SAR324 cluster bacterium]